MASDLQAKALLKQLQASTSDNSAIPLRKIDVPQDSSWWKRFLRLIFFAVLPLIACVWFILNWAFQCSPSPAAALAKSPPTPAVVPTVKMVGSLFDTTMGRSPSLPGGGAPGAPAAVVVPLVKCYARVDAAGVYSQTQVLKDGMFLAERFTRVLGGMIYNSRYGWYLASDFGCSPGLEEIEVEFMPPVIPTRTVVPTRRPVVAAKTSTPVPVATAAPTATLANGIISFAAPSCDLVSYLVWNVKAVYLVKNGVKVGVPGDNQGQAVITSVCPYSGTLTLAAVSNDGSVLSRSVVIQ